MILGNGAQRVLHCLQCRTACLQIAGHHGLNSIRPGCGTLYNPKHRNIYLIYRDNTGRLISNIIGVRKTFNTYNNKAYMVPSYCTKVELNDEEQITAKSNDDNVSDSDVKSLCADILRSLREADVTFYSIHISDVQKRIQALLDSGCTLQQCQNLFMENGYLLKSESFFDYLTLLSESGFNEKLIYRTLSGYGQIVDKDIEKVKATIEHLRKILKSVQSFRNAISVNPGILSLDANIINGRLSILHGWFKQSDSITLIENCPSVLFDEVQVLQDKFDYVHHAMGVSQRQMLYSRLFEHSLFHIQARHTFLVRAGLFKKINKDKGQINTNPMLQDILDTSDAVFAKRFGGMEEIDYKCFVEYFKMEIATIQNIDT